MFVLGMVVNLSDAYKVRSNRESGFGRYDVRIERIDRTHIVWLCTRADSQIWICISGERMSDRIKIDNTYAKQVIDKC